MEKLILILLILFLLLSFPSYSETIYKPGNIASYTVENIIKISMDNILRYEMMLSNVKLLNTDFSNNGNNAIYTFELLEDSGWVMFYKKDFKQARSVIYLRKP